MSEGRSSEIAILLSGPEGVMFIGGSNQISQADFFDAASGHFSILSGLGPARSLEAATVLRSGLVLYAGGVSGTSLVATAATYDPHTEALNQVGPLATARVGGTALRLVNGKVLILGGADMSGAPIASAEVFNPDTLSFSSTGALNIARTAPTITLLTDGRVLVAGGSNPPTQTFNSAEIYDPQSGEFTFTGNMHYARADAAAVILRSGRALIVGGSQWNNGVTALSQSEIYDPKTGIFVDTGAMFAARFRSSASVLKSGDVLVAAGQTDSGPLASAEIYSVSSGLFRQTGSMLQARSSAAAMTLTSGRILISGGAGRTKILDTAEIYTPDEILATGFELD